MNKLEPVDSKRCQAEVREGNFMTFGPRRYSRCNNQPKWIAVDVREGIFYGAMSLCDDCKRVCEIQIRSVNFQDLV